MTLNRSVESDLEKWHQQTHRKPLVVRGARQVGKSTLIKSFAVKKGLKLYEINFERHPTFNKKFENLGIQEILLEIEFLCGIGKIDPQTSLLFFDEIQAAPQAIKALRYFYEDRPELAIVAAGSLLEFALADISFSMPVGRIEYLFMGPMTFEEFLAAKGEWEILRLIRNFQLGDHFPESAQQRLLYSLREFLLVGGMPEAVARYVETKDFNECMNVHSSILETYRDDFSKYAKGADLLHLQRVFAYVPATVGEKIKYNNIDEHSQARDLRKAIDLLTKAHVIGCVHHSKASGIPLAAGKNDKIYKMYFLDVGLMNRMCGVQTIPLAQLESTKFLHEGKMAEQFIQQHLLYHGRRNETPQLFYWLRENRSANAEVDFIIQAGPELIPVEVKAGKSGALKSLQRFIWEKQLKKAFRFDLNTPSRQDISHKMSDSGQTLQSNFTLTSLPLYMVDQISRFI